ncbi:MAG: autorepressor SdpR family transcription factor [Roseiflexaceae bacterium]|nr:autorepressor SdpR family transcription factor [Chloroflexaceae bacterium]
MGLQETLKALADPVRRAILLFLRDGRQSAGAIAAQFDVTQATVSYHLAQLKQAGLIFEAKDKNYIYYELNTSVFEEVLLFVAQLQAREE